MAKANTNGTYTLYFSETQKQSNEAEQQAQAFSNLYFPGSYPFLDQQSSKRYEATEFVPDTVILGMRLRGRPTCKDAVLVATGIPAAALRCLPRMPLAEARNVIEAEEPQALHAMAG